MELLYGQPVANDMLTYVKNIIELSALRPKLLLCDTPDGSPYGRGIRKDAAYCGIEIIDNVDYITNPGIDGAISLNGTELADDINMDGGDTAPCTAEAIIKVLKYYDMQIKGRHVVIVGRSQRVGRPLAKLMLDLDATVTVCHSATRYLWNRTTDADILVSCTGKHDIITGTMIKPGAVVIDVGAPLPDVNLSGGPELRALVPSKGGVGPVTRSVLMLHVVRSALNRRNK